MKTVGVPQLRGCYKLSDKVINRLLSRHIIGKDESVYDTVSNYELLSVIYFSQICDVSGVIDEIKISELAYILGCSRRSAYNILYNLENKGFIEYQTTAWKGYRRIKLLNNDFTDADYTSVRYATTNFLYLDPSAEEYTQFKNISLYAKKTLLIILYNYRSSLGYRVSFSKLTEHLAVKNRLYSHKYINELKEMFGEDAISVNPSLRTTAKYDTISIKPNTYVFNHENSINIKQYCYFKHKLRTELRHLKISFTSVVENVYSYSSQFSLEDIHIHKLYQIASNYLKKGTTFNAFYSSLISIIKDFGLIDEYVIRNVSSLLSPKHLQTE